MDIGSVKPVLLVSMVDVSAYGIRLLTAYLNSVGRSADLLTLRLSDNQKSLLTGRPIEPIQPGFVQNFLRFIKNYPYIGFSLFSDSFHECVLLSREIKKAYPGKTIIWGGVHPTLKTAECLEYADYVCVGEGYVALQELLEQLDRGELVADNDDLKPPKGIWRKKSGFVQSTGTGEFISNIDSQPFPTYDPRHVFVRNDDNSVSNLDRADYRNYLDYVYYTMFSLGCPYHCSYCANNAYKRLDKQYGKIRQHSVDYMFREIKEAQKHYTFYNVYFMDDFFILSNKKLFDEFVERYPHEIGLPFIATGVIPRMTKREHIGKLIQAGMVRSRTGIQTGSQRMLEIYRRKQNNEDIIKISEWFSEYRGKIVPLSYDLILDGAGETIDDTIETFLLISRLSRPLILNLASLRGYPGTEIVQIMEEYEPGKTVSYTMWNDTVINSLIALESVVPIPRFIINFLVERKTFLEKSVPKLVTKILYYLILLQKTIYHLRYGEYSSKPCWIVDYIRKISASKRYIFRKLGFY